jgi:hypothetical protein
MAADIQHEGARKLLRIIATSDPGEPTWINTDVIVNIRTSGTTGVGAA